MDTQIQQSDIHQRVATWSKLGLGSGTLASLGRRASLREVDRLLSVMLDAEVTVVDTADSYGSGDCEILLGKALQTRRESFSVVTKAGYSLANLKGPLRPLNQFLKKAVHRYGNRQCHEPAYLIKSLDASLKRLKMNHVDTFLLHDPPLEAVSNIDVLEACDSLKKAGKIIRIGISSSAPEILEAAIATNAYDVIQTPASLRVVERMLPIWRKCEANGIHIIVNHVFDPYCLNHPDVTHEKLMRITTALLPFASTILCGTRNPAHLLQANSWAHDPLPESESTALARMFGQVI